MKGMGRWGTLTSLSNSLLVVLVWQVSANEASGLLVDFFYLFDSCPQLTWINEPPVLVDGFMILLSLLKILWYIDSIHLVRRTLRLWGIKLTSLASPTKAVAELDWGAPAAWPPDRVLAWCSPHLREQRAGLRRRQCTGKITTKVTVRWMPVSQGRFGGLWLQHTEWSWQLHKACCRTVPCTSEEADLKRTDLSGLYSWSLRWQAVKLKPASQPGLLHLGVSTPLSGAECRSQPLLSPVSDLQQGALLWYSSHCIDKFRMTTFALF